MTIALQVLLMWLVATPLDVVGVWDTVATAQVRRRLKAMREAGEPVTMAELAKTYPDPPKGRNAAHFFNAAFKKMKEREDRAEGDDLPIVGTGQLPDVAADFPPLMFEAIETYLNEQADILKLLRQGTACEGCKFDLDFEAGPGMLLPHLASMRQGARLFALEAIARTEGGEADGAAGSLRSGLRLGHALRQEPVLITALVRIACDAITVGQVQRWACRARPSPKALRRVEGALRAEADPAMLKRVFLAERCFGMDIYQRYVLKPGGGRLAELVGQPPGNAGLLLRVVPRAYFKSDMVHYIDLMNAYVAAMRKPYPGSFVEGARVGRDLGKQIPRHYVVCRLILPALGRVFITGQRHMAAVESARLGLAALRYERKHGRPPEQLEALAPDFVDALPPDPYTGKALRYRREPTGFVIYAVGENGADDGGNIERVDGKQPDVGFRLRRPKAQF